MQFCCKNKEYLLNCNLVALIFYFCRMKSIRNTVAKVAIKKLLEQSEQALSQGDIQAEVGDLCNRVTIYRILDRLVEEGYAHRVMDVDGVARYAACSSSCTTHHQHDHVHFSCEKCNQVTCLEDVRPQFSLPKTYQVNSINFTLSGICQDCSE